MATALSIFNHYFAQKRHSEIIPTDCRTNRNRTMWLRFTSASRCSVMSTGNVLISNNIAGTYNTFHWNVNRYDKFCVWCRAHKCVFPTFNGHFVEVFFLSSFIGDTVINKENCLDWYGIGIGWIGNTRTHKSLSKKCVGKRYHQLFQCEVTHSYGSHHPPNGCFNKLNHRWIKFNSTLAWISKMFTSVTIGQHRKNMNLNEFLTRANRLIALEIVIN